MSTKFANDSNTNARPEKPFIARMIHAFAVPIILGWLAVCVVVTVFVPSLEAVGQERSVSLSPKDAPSFEAMGRIGMVFKEGDSDSFAMVIIEGNQPLGDAAHKYYDGLVAQLRADKKHVQSVQEFMGDHSPPRACKVTTARPPMFNCHLPATKARRWPTNPSRQYAASSKARPRRRA